MKNKTLKSMDLARVKSVIFVPNNKYKNVTVILIIISLNHLVTILFQIKVFIKFANW